MADNKIHIRTVTIPVGATAPTDVVDLNDLVLVGIITPPTVAGSSLSFFGAGGNTALNKVYDSEGDAVAVAIGANRFIALSPTLLAGVTKVRIISNAAASGSPEEYDLVLREIN